VSQTVVFQRQVGADHTGPVLLLIILIHRLIIGVRFLYDLDVVLVDVLLILLLLLVGALVLVLVGMFGHGYSSACVFHEILL
jgi:hypothetical protein